VDIYYIDRKLKKSCSNLKVMSETYGISAEKISKRIQDLEDFHNLKEYFEGAKGDPHPVVYNSRNCYAVQIDSTFKIIFDINQEIVRDENGEICLDQITSIIILAVNCK